MIKSILVISAVLFFQGCLIFHKVSYEIKLNGPTTGTARILVHDIRSDARSELSFEEDKYNLFDYALKSSDFVKKLEQEGKKLVDRQLYNSDDTLTGKIEYTFQDISKIENISFENGFYYMELTPEDSVIFTNGEILHSEGKKMIVWDRSFSTLQFTLFSTSFPEGTTARELLPYLD